MPTPVQCGLPIRERASGSAPHSHSGTQDERSSAFLDTELPACPGCSHPATGQRETVGKLPLFLSCLGPEGHTSFLFPYHC